MTTRDFKFEEADSFTYLASVANSGYKKCTLIPKSWQANHAQLPHIKILMSNPVPKYQISTTQNSNTTHTDFWIGNSDNDEEANGRDREALKEDFVRVCEIVRGGHCRIRTNKETNDILQGEDIVKCIKFLRLRPCGRAQRVQNQRMPKQFATATMEEIK